MYKYQVNLQVYDTNLCFLCDNKNLYNELVEWFDLFDQSTIYMKNVDIDIWIVICKKETNRHFLDNLKPLKWTSFPIEFQIYRGADSNWYFVKDTEWFIQLDTNKNQITANISTEDSTAISFFVRTILKTVIPLALVYHNIYPVHGAVVSFNEKGVLLLGPPESGKSTLSLYLISKGYKFVCDDRMFLKKENNHIVVWGGHDLFTCGLGTVMLLKNIEGVGGTIDKIINILPKNLNELPGIYKAGIKVHEIFSNSRIVTTIPKLCIFPSLSDDQNKELIIKKKSKISALKCIILENMHSSLDIEKKLGIFEALNLLVNQTECYDVSLKKGSSRSILKFTKWLYDSLDKNNEQSRDI